MLITPEQIRAARALLRLDQARLARDAGISIVTLRRPEQQHGLAKVAPAIVNVVRGALEKAGAEFIDRGVRRSALTPTGPPIGPGQ
jgi:transcriptional regulator with XRE-family HTH domain